MNKDEKKTVIGTNFCGGLADMTQVNNNNQIVTSNLHSHFNQTNVVRCKLCKT